MQLCDAGCEGDHALERAVKPLSCASVLPTVNLHQVVNEAVMMSTSLAMGWDLKSLLRPLRLPVEDFSHRA